jgi:sialate O-acetylesterase
MAVTTDLGIPGEKLIPESLQAGRRLALLARHRAYGEEIVDSGPLFRSMRVEGNKLRLQFDSKGSGLSLGIPHRLTQQGDRPRSVDPKLSGFAIAGADQRWHPATGRIEGEGAKQSVLLWSDAVVRPVAARYDWKGFPEGNLYNRNGLPAPPFRTDLDQPR